MEIYEYRVEFYGTQERFKEIEAQLDEGTFAIQGHELACNHWYGKATRPDKSVLGIRTTCKPEDIHAILTEALPKDVDHLAFVAVPKHLDGCGRKIIESNT